MRRAVLSCNSSSSKYLITTNVTVGPKIGKSSCFNSLFALRPAFPFCVIPSRGVFFAQLSAQTSRPDMGIQFINDKGKMRWSIMVELNEL